MLYGKHLGLGGSIRALEQRGDAKLAKLKAAVEEVKQWARSEGAMPVKAVFRFFPARAEGERLILQDPGNGHATAAWDLPRQARAPGLCIADYVLAGDHVALFVTTAGERIRERVEEFKRRGEYLKSHILAALALETAEAAAEVVHRRLRAAWGFADPPGLPRHDLFAARYRGKRYSFGYPACPDLAGQRQLFAALKPEEIGVTLTEGDMMDPEASVSALVFHHPEARYFGV
jgi:5-methyltetrahydrofolate--homocysteine methyltransferase